MKHYLLVLNLFIIISTLSFCSNKVNSPRKDNATNCYALLIKISDFWKIDSLSNNGYRYEIVRNNNFLNCVSNRVPTDSIIKYLGPPNKVDTTGNKENYYLKYYYLNTMNIPKNNIIWGSYRIIHYISFMQDTNNITTQISIGHSDY